jgi:Tfp pilus assembly protein FimT
MAGVAIRTRRAGIGLGEGASASGRGKSEFAVIAVIVGLVVAVLLPVASGYQSISQVRGAAIRFANDIVAARAAAISQDRPVLLQVHAVPTVPWRGWTVSAGTTRLRQGSVPSSINVTSHCSQATFTPLGNAVPMSPCRSSPATLICFDNSRGSVQVVSIQASVVLATGQVTLVQGSGPCT